MEDDSIIQGEHNITEVPKKIIDVFYKETPTINPKAIQAIQEADLIILSMGSIFTSIIPNLICPEIIEAIDNSKASIMYTCNMMTQPGETDNFKASDHIKLLNNYLGKRKIDVIISNNGPISKSYRDKYATLEQKEAVIFDKRELQKLGLKVIASNFVIVEDDVLRHNSIKLSSYIFSYTL